VSSSEAPHVLASIPAEKPSFWQRWQRTLLRRVLARPINASGVLLLQAVPLSITRCRFEFDVLRRLWTHGGVKGNDVDLIRMAFLAVNIASLEENEVPGAFAEIGVWRGNSAKVIHQLAPRRRLYLFDTFCGFDHRDAQVDLASGVMVHFRDTSMDEVRAFLGDSESLHFVPGRFPDTAAAVPPDEQFAFVHLDCDLQQPTKAALDFFYPRMSAGGLIVVHDYGSGRWPGVTHAVDHFLADKLEGLVRIPDMSGTAVLVRANLAMKSGRASDPLGTESAPNQ
jgi:macrocin-O-methyltransferase TylF-like protien